MSKGYRTLLFGVLIGTVNYLAGNVTSGLVKYITQGMGFNEHGYDNLLNTTYETTSYSKEGIYLETESIEKNKTYVALDYKKLIKLEEYWGPFFNTYRFLILLAPWLLYGCIETGVIMTFALQMLFMS